MSQDGKGSSGGSEEKAAASVCKQTTDSPATALHTHPNLRGASAAMGQGWVLESGYRGQSQGQDCSWLCGDRLKWLQCVAATRGGVEEAGPP